MYGDLHDAHEVSVDDEDEYDDVPTGKLSTCAEDSFHNIVNQIGEEMPDNYEESTFKETDDKFGTEVNKVNETFEVYGNLNNELKISEGDDASSEENDIKMKGDVLIM